MCLNPRKILNPNPSSFSSMYIDVPCGKCVECCKQNATEWAFRCCIEAANYKDNCFVTLTYNDEFCDGNLHKKHVQDFIKRLRSAISPQKFRYRLCGEYGAKGKRPHYHVLIFGYSPKDLIFLKTTNKGEFIYRSALIEKEWKFGFSSVGKITFNSAKYCSKYLQKLVEPPDGCVRPFTMQSTKPGIGYCGIFEPSVITDKIYLNGSYIKIPRYFLKVLEKEYGTDLSDLKERRQKNAEIFAEDFEKKKERRKNLEEILF